MARHNQTGKMGETMAKYWAAENGYYVIAMNWRYRKLELDMVATKNDKLHFFEVKTRSNTNFGYPEKLVGKKKLFHFICAGTAYIRMHPQYKWVRFNILSILLSKENGPSFYLIEDVYL
jgi:putative endonuclease